MTNLHLTNLQMTNLRIDEMVLFRNLMKIGTDRIKRFTVGDIYHVGSQCQACLIQ